MFSNTVEYALRAMVYLAARRVGWSGARAIADVTHVPPRYLSKILKDLVEAGLIASQRGPNGGFRLVREPEEISVLEVVNAVDRIQRIRACPLNLPEHRAQLCRLHRTLDDAIATIERAFDAATIADLVEPEKPGLRGVFPTIRGGAPGAGRGNAKGKAGRA